MSPEQALPALLQRWRDIWLLTSTAAVLDWDEQTGMPGSAAAFRGEQTALLAGLHHQHLLDERLGDLAALVATSSDPGIRAQGEHALRQHRRARRLPRALVEEQKRVAAVAQRAWVDARDANDIAAYEPWLARTITLKREEAQALALEGQEPYEALLDEFEPGARIDDVMPMLRQLAVELAPLVQSATTAPQRPDPALLSRAFDVEKQRVLGQMVAVALGYDLTRGRIDLTTHPFCTTLGADDVRLAVRYAEDNFSDGFFATVHEVGHGLYEQGVPADLVGTPAGEPHSLGLHESQSRLWENLVARSHPFWRHWLPVLRQMFPEVVSDVDEDAFVGAVNAVVPGAIRVGADEVTYNLHIVVRVELERALINGGLEARDLKDAWTSSYQQTLGITPHDDNEGLLQDGHWSAGLFGYFATYTLGNLYAAQLWAAARAAVGDVDDELVATGGSASLVRWLNHNVHQHASTRSAARIVTDATGAAPSSQAFLAHLRQRLALHRML